MYSYLLLISCFLLRLSQYDCYLTSFKSNEHLHTSSTTKLNFKEPQSNEGNSIFGALKRFLPWVQRAKLDKSYAEPAPSTGMRYQFRLLKPDINADLSFRRHVVTRIIRYFPGTKICYLFNVTCYYDALLIV